MTDKNLKYTPPTYKQFILAEKDLYPDLVQEDISSQGGYGLCRNSGGYTMSTPIAIGCLCSKERLLEQLR